MSVLQLLKMTRKMRDDVPLRCLNWAAKLLVDMAAAVETVGFGYALLLQYSCNDSTFCRT